MSQGEGVPGTATVAQFAGEVYRLADASVPDYLSWHVRMYDDPIHATPTPVVELRVAQGARGRKVSWTGEFIAQEHEAHWESMIREGIDKMLRGIAV
jgi:hypothetical protein